MNPSNTVHYQHSQANTNEPFETIELNEVPFPKYLPLRPGEYPFWRKPIVFIATGTLLFTILIAGTTIGSIFVGREMQTAKYRNMPTAIIYSTTTVMITHTKLVADYSEYTDMRLQSTVIITATEYIRPEAKSTFSLPLLMTPPLPAPSSTVTAPAATSDAPQSVPSDCSQIGLWSLDEAECKELCWKMVGKTFKTSECKSNGRFWRCVVCP